MEIEKLKLIYKLKSIYRFNSVENRKESSAEHSWSCLILADYFLNKCNLKLNRLKVYELLMYHDLVEIEAGDSPLHPNIKVKNKKERENKAVKTLKDALPKHISTKFYDLFKEFEAQKTKEAKFAKAIDALDAIIHELDYKEDWKNWTEDFLKEKKLKYFKDFKCLEDFFYNLLNYLKENNYF